MTRHNRAPASNLKLCPLPKLRPLTRMIAGLSAMSMALPALAIDEYALPQQGEVTHGSATISRQGSNMGIQQNSARTVIDWQSFDIGSEAGVNFSQPDAASIAVNRINNSASPSEIHGNLQANGQVWLLNPNGVMFGATAQVDVTGLLATSARLNTAEFMAGNARLEFEGGNRGSIINEGDISIREGGLAAFVAPRVQNSGRIHAHLGKVSLAAGDTFTLDLAGDGLLELGLSAGKQARVEQLGEVMASGGVIEIATGAASAAVDDIINLSGYTSAASAEVVGGEIILSGGNVEIAGTVDASGAGGGGQVDIRADNITTTANADLRADALGNGDGGLVYAYADSHGDYNGNFSARGGEAGGNGGFIETSGKAVSLDAALSVNTSAPNGNNGTWRIDPADLIVGAGEATAIVSNLNSGNVEVEAENSITVDSTIDSSPQSNANTLSFLDENNDSDLTIDLNAAITLGANQSLSGEGTFINVSDSGLIQNGIDVAASGADVNVAAGTYAEDLIIDKSLQLVGAGDDATTIQGQDGGQAAAVNISADDVTLGGSGAGEGFRIEGAGLRAVYLNEGVSGATIQNNTIVAAENKLALDSTGSQSNHTIQSNTFTAAGSGTNKQLVYINGTASLGSGRASSGVDILNNNFEGNAQLALGMEAGNSRIEGNTFTGSNSYAALELWEAPDSLTGNSFSTDTAAHLRLSANASTGELDYGLLTDILNNNDFSTAVLNSATTGNVNVGESATVFGRIQSAADAASAGDVLNIASGNYGQAVIDKNLSITGIGTKPVIKPNDNFTGTNATGAWILVDEGVDFSLSNLVLDGDGYQINQALRSHGNTNISNVDFKNILGSHIYSGIALTSYGGTVGGGSGSDSHGGSGLSASHLTVTDSSFDNIGRISVLIKGDGATADISGSTFTGKGGGDFLDYAIEVGAGGNANITDNIISGNRGQASSDGSTSAGILVTTYYGAGSQATLTDNHISDSTAAVAIGYDDSDSSTVNANDNTFANTDIALMLTSLGLTTNIENNTFSNNNTQLLNTESGFDVDPILSGNNFDRAVVVRDGENIAVSRIFSLIQEGINAAATGNTVDVLAGNYAEILQVNATDNLTIQAEEGALIDASDITGNNRIVDLRANGTTFSGFEILGPGAGAGINVGISISGQNSVVTNNTISDVLTGIQTTTMHTSGNGLISGNTVNADYGISLQNNGNSVSNNTVTAAVEGVGLLDGNNSFTGNTFTLTAGADTLAFYGSASVADLLASTNTVNIQDDTNLPGAADLAGAGGFLNLANGTYNLGSTFNIDQSLTLAGESQTGTIINAATNGYGIHVTADNVSLSNFTLNGPSADAGSSYGIKVSPTGGADARLNNFSIADVTIQGSGRAELDLNGVTGATITNVTADGQGTAGAGIQLTDSANITLTGVTTLDNLWGGVALYQSNRYFNQQTTNINIDANDNAFNEFNGLFAQDSSDGTGTSVVGGDGLDFGVMNLSGFTHIVENNDFRNGENGHPADNIGEQFTFFHTSLADAFEFAVNLNDTVTAASTVQGWTGSDTDNNFYVGSHDDNAMSIQTAINTTDSGNTINIFAGTYAEILTVSKTLNLTGFDVAVDGLTFNGSGSSISGSFSSSGEGFSFSGPLSLSDDLSLTTTGTAIINTADINGTAAGEQSLTLNAEGEIALGSLGETTLLGTTVISSSDTTLNGDSYNAESLAFSGPVTLTSANTLFDASQGNISFNGDIVGSSPGEQSITFSAGDGLDANSGDVILQNLGTEALKLGDLNVTANDFSAATVWLAGDFNSVLSGDQVFTDQTLNADGNVSSQVSGNASGPINSQGSVALAIMGAFSGNVSGNNVTLSARSIEAIINAIESASVSADESYSGSISAANIVLAATTVDAELSGGTATVDAQSGNISGNVENLTITNDDGGSFQIDVPNYTPPINRDEVNFQQFYSQSFQNPDNERNAFADNRPAAETLASNTVTVAGIDNLPGLLSEGNGAILIDLSPGYDREEEKEN